MRPTMALVAFAGLAMMVLAGCDLPATGPGPQASRPNEPPPPPPPPGFQPPQPAQPVPPPAAPAQPQGGPSPILPFAGAGPVTPVAPFDFNSSMGPVAPPSPPMPVQPMPTPTPPPPGTTDVKAEAGVGVRGQGYEPGFITTPIRAYFRVRERVAFDVQIPHAMQLYKATNGQAPQSHEQFMQDIIQANSIRLPELPPGEQYIYDPATEQLMVRSPR